jgi:hypothetical protein
VSTLLPRQPSTRTLSSGGRDLQSEHPDVADRRFAACAHTFGYRGHCLTKSRRYSTTFKALHEARERHVHEQLLAHGRDGSHRAEDAA